MADSVYRITEVVGTSSESWEAAARNAVETAAKTVRDLRVAEVVREDVTIEDGIRVGGAGTFLVDAMAALDENRHIPPVLVLGIPVAYVPQGKPAQILADLGLDGRGIAASVRNVLEASSAPAPLDLD